MVGLLFKDGSVFYMKKIINWFSDYENLILIGIILAAFLLRTYKFQEFFLYGPDNDLAGWIVKDIVVNHHWRLIGQQTSTMGVFVGPLYYYYLIPFYLLTKMDPIGSVYAITILAMLSVVSVYFVFSRLFGKKTGLTASFIYSVSLFMINNDHDVVPTMPVILWTVWYFYGINLLLKGDRKGYLLLGLLVGLMWHINMALVLVLPLIPLALIIAREKINFKHLFTGALATLILSIPLVIFELRHNFSQVKAFVTSLTTSQSIVFTLAERLGRVIELTGRNLKQFLLPGTPDFHKTYLLLVLLIIFAVLIIKKIIAKKLAIVMSTWVLLYFVFFTLYSKVLSEYYLNGLTIIWLAIITLPIGYLLKGGGWKKKLALIFLGGYFAVNHIAFASVPINHSGYLEKKEIVAYIDQDRLAHKYPCIAISYITEPGYDLGYRYFFWLRRMHVNAPISRAPVYTIVFPLNKVNKVDRQLGALGLIFPDYKKYNINQIAKSCSGANSNVVDSIPGYTE